MKKNNLKRFLASLLAVLMLASVTGVSPAVFAADNDAAAQSEGTAAPVLRNGEAVIPEGSDAGTVKKILAKSLISNYDQLDPDSRDNLDWEFECVGWQKLDSQHKFDSNTVFGDINGFESHKDKKIGLVTTTLNFQHDALASQADGSYKVRLKSNPNTVVFLSKVAKLSSNIVANDNVSVKLAYNDDGTINYTNINEAVFKAAVKSSTPNLTVNDVTITYEAKSGLDTDWMPLKGGKGTILTYPGVTEGTHKVRIEYSGNDTYYGTKAELNVTFTGREASAITFKENPVVKITYNDQIQIDFEKLYEAVWDNVVASTTPELRRENVKITYYAHSVDYEWVPLEGGKGTFVTYPAISEGTQKIRFEFAGNASYTGFSEEITVNFVGREAVPDIANKDISVNASFNEEDLSINYDALRKAIWEQVSVGLPENVKFEDVSFTYKFNYGIDYWPTFEGKLEIGSLDIPIPSLGIGENTVKLAWGGDKEYKSWEQEITVDVVDNRIVSVIGIVSNPSITYNKDGSAEKDAIIANVIDYTNSTLPTDAKFTVECKGGITGNAWKDIAENPMDAGENQEIRISFAGNTEYKPCTLETTITVKKAPVSITLPIISKLYAGNEVDPATFYTVNPKDSAIDVYIFFIGINSYGESCVNVKFTPKQEKVIDAISDIQKSFGVSEDQTLYAKLRSGMTVGEFKEMMSKVIDYIDNPVNNWILEKLGVNVDSIKNIVKAFDMLTSISEDTVIGYGTPAHAGVYQAIAVSPETKNYEAGKGTGSLVILKNWKGIKLDKNPDIFEGSEITESEAKAIAEGNESLCILTQDGKPLNDASAGSIHYWFTGVNRIHVGSKMPTAPGKYIVTASVRGGDFFAFPKTFSFTIVNDPAPEA